VREYRLYHDEAGWILPSLPLVVGDHNRLDSLPLPQNMLINWRGKPFTYHYVTFSEVFNDLASQHKQRPSNEFTNKIVIIGSTASGLFDIKPTAMDKQFPGVEVLATAIDNVKHRDYLKVWRGKTPYVLLSLLFIWATTLAFYFKVDREKFNSIFTGSQIGLLVLSYLAINLTNTYLDLTAPILWAVAYFGIAKIYALATDRALQRWLAFGVKSDKEDATVLMMAILIDTPDILGEAINKSIKRQMELSSKTPNSVEILHGVQTGIWGLFGDIFIASWVYSSKDQAYSQSAYQDAQRIAEQLPNIIADVGLPSSTLMRYATHEGKLNYTGQGDAQALVASQWRTLFAQAIIKLEHVDAQTSED
jgi:adenylate cyclase